MAARSQHARPQPSSSSEAVEDYAKAIYALAQRADGPVGTSELAERLGVTPATATAMLKRLDERGLVRHRPYRGVTLTAEGERLALEVIRHHRLLEAYLSDVMGMPWDRVHEEAEVLEHYISEEFERLIAEKLGDPAIDPHGDPIPGPDLLVPDEEETVALHEMKEGAAATFTRVSDSDPRMLRYLADRGIRPGVRVVLVERHPFDGPLEVEVAGERHALGGPLARAMRVSAAA
jgi:DtxR family Mn-dependent transcriptional regulator